MGIRINITNNPAFDVRHDLDRIGIASPNLSAQQTAARPTIQTNASAGRIETEPLSHNPVAATTPPMNSPNAAAASLETAGANETVGPANNGPPLAEANAEPNTSEISKGPAPSIRRFRYLTSPGSMRERELDARLNQLEQRLETASKRLQFADSVIERVDAGLERARLEHDMDVVGDEIRRMRLEQIFSTLSLASASSESQKVTTQTTQATGGAIPDTQPSAQDPILNLLA
ncbi:hypothetical protein HZA56_09955 [Candidatus Poribacteria bacterium]|nr:hypothetical protein [Candidatus Poribacteria bacterium]